MLTKKQANEIAGCGSATLSKPSKMPCPGWSIDPKLCIVGGKLSLIPGSACWDCYAKKDHYRTYSKSVKRAWANRLKGYHGPMWVPCMVRMILGLPEFRWFDAGDLQSLEMLERIVEIAVQTPNTKHWLPTQEHAIVRWYKLRHGEFPGNLVVRESGPMIDGPPPRTDQPTSTQHSELGKPHHGIECQSMRNGGSCGDCRLCWDPTVANISYLHH